MLGMALMYVVVGMIVFGLVILVHLISAESRGYWAFNYWEAALPEIEYKPTTSQFILTMIIWPIRLWQFIALIPTFYDVYTRRPCVSRRRR